MVTILALLNLKLLGHMVKHLSMKSVWRIGHTFEFLIRVQCIQSTFEHFHLVVRGFSAFVIWMGTSPPARAFEKYRNSFTSLARYTPISHQADLSQTVAQFSVFWYDLLLHSMHMKWISSAPPGPIPGFNFTIQWSTSYHGPYFKSSHPHPNGARTGFTWCSTDISIARPWHLAFVQLHYEF